MHYDNVVWKIIGEGFCSFKTEVRNTKQKFCRNLYNLTGVCNQYACPLANSNYATVKEKEGKLYLLTKTAERLHMPAKWWEWTELPEDKNKAETQIEEILEYWPDYFADVCKERYLKLSKYKDSLIEMELNPNIDIEIRKKQIDRIDLSREEKAERAAKLEKIIQNELLQRLKEGVYGDIYNLDQNEFEKILDLQKINEQNPDITDEYIMEEDFESDSDESLDSNEDKEQENRTKKTSSDRHIPWLNIEYDSDDEPMHLNEE